MPDDETILEEQKEFENLQRGKQKRQKRIEESVKKNDAMYKKRNYVKMWQTHGFPHKKSDCATAGRNRASEEAWDHDGKSIQNTGIYLQHPKNSNGQKYHKRESHKKVRRYYGDLNNGRHEQKLYDYDWNLI